MAKDYKLYSDSTSDLSDEVLAEIDVHILSLTCELDGRPFVADEKHMQVFYNQMRAGAMTKTSQIPPSVYETAFEKDIQDGFDILYLGFSSGLSGSYNGACIARDTLLEKYPEAKIICIDSLCASTGEGLLLFKADEKKKSGMDIDHLAEWLEANKLHLCHVFTVDDLKYLHRGGRVSKATAIAGTIIGIKPVMHVDNDGHLVAVGKVRGRKQSLKRLVDMMQERVGGWDNKVVAICHGDCIDDANYVATLIRERFGAFVEVLTSYTGAVIGSHSGPGTIALFFMGEER